MTTRSEGAWSEPHDYAKEFNIKLQGIGVYVSSIAQPIFERIKNVEETQKIDLSLLAHAAERYTGNTISKLLIRIVDDPNLPDQADLEKLMSGTEFNEQFPGYIQDQIELHSRNYSETLRKMQLYESKLTAELNNGDKQILLRYEQDLATIKNDHDSFYNAMQFYTTHLEHVHD